jgi:hypothetical protein
MDYLEKFQQMIDEYNSGSVNGEEHFRRLVEFSKTLNAEERRGIAEGLSDAPRSGSASSRCWTVFRPPTHRTYTSRHANRPTSTYMTRTSGKGRASTPSRLLDRCMSLDHPEFPVGE